MLKSPENTEAKILSAARDVFTTKGMEGARMQEIADRAGINKALLHYYFRSKNNLFDAILKESLEEIFPRIAAVLSSELPLFEKIERFAEEYIILIMERPYLPVFIINELNRDPAFMERIIGAKAKGAMIRIFALQIEEEVKKGNIIPIEATQLIVHLISLCIFPVCAKPMIKLMVGIKEKDYDAFLHSRKKEVPAFIIQSIRAK